MKPVYFSTACFQEVRLLKLLEEAAKFGIHHIELSSGIEIQDSIRSTLANFSDFYFLVHNYFPPEESNLVINLSTKNRVNRKNSINFAKNSINLCSEIGAPFYSIHSGFCSDLTSESLGNDQTKFKCIPKEEAFKYFRESLYLLHEYAKSQGVKLLIENNVVEARNLINGVNQIDLMSNIDDFAYFMTFDELREVGFLIDFGHLNVSSASEKFSRTEFLNLTASRIQAFHISDNNRVIDQHHPPLQNAWFISWISKMPFATCIIEAKFSSMKLLCDTQKLISRVQSQT